MQTKLMFAAAAFLLSTSALAEEDLKPAQEEGKAAFEEKIADAVKATNDKCGTKLAVKTDFQNFKADAGWSALSYASYCEAVLDGIQAMCDRAAYKKVLTKKLKGVECLLAGAKPAEKDDGSSGTTRRNMSFSGGKFVYHVAEGHANITDVTKEVLEKALN